MSSYDRYWSGSGNAKKPIDQILTSWFLEAHSKRILSQHFLRKSSWAIVKAKISCGIFEYQEFNYVPVFYKGLIPSSEDQEVFLSFRKFSNSAYQYGYVMIKVAS